jgi:ABC-type xylose transport system substrate-binding protein
VVAHQTVNNGAFEVPSVLEDVIVATRDNMMDTVVRDGFLLQQDVYGGAR